MADYCVTWAIELKADNPKSAAEQALKFIQENGSEQMFTVMKMRGKHLGKTVVVDLAESSVSAAPKTGEPLIESA